MLPFLNWKPSLAVVITYAVSTVHVVFRVTEMTSHSAPCFWILWGDMWSEPPPGVSELHRGSVRRSIMSFVARDMTSLLSGWRDQRHAVWDPCFGLKPVVSWELFQCCTCLFWSMRQGTVNRHIGDFEKRNLVRLRLTFQKISDKAITRSMKILATTYSGSIAKW